jgi:hypothetical protein
VCISGNAESVDPVFKAVVGEETGPMLPRGGLFREAGAACVRQVLPHPVGDLLGAGTQEAITRRNSRRLELARAQGVQLADLRWTHDELIITWKNCQSALSGAVPMERLHPDLKAKQTVP